MKKDDCVICAGEGSCEFYEEGGGTIEIIACIIVGLKLCNPHALRLDAELTKREKKQLERSVA